MESDLISIIMPAYNSENTITDTIISVLNQTYKNFELIIVNDGSTDNTKKIIENLAMSDKRIRIISNKNSGVSYSRNCGIKNSCGEYITFIDSDDLYLPDYLEKLYNVMQRSRVDWAICSYIYFNKNEKKNLLGKNFSTDNKQEIIENLYPVFFKALWNKMYYSKIIKSNNLQFCEKISIAEDLEFNLNYIKFVNKVSYIDSCLYKYRVTNDGLGFSFRMDANEIKINMIEKIEQLYIDNKYEMNFVFKNYIIQYVSYISRIFNKNNKMMCNEKRDNIVKLINSENYIKHLRKVSKSKNVKYKVFANILLRKSVFEKKIIAFLGNTYDLYNKNKIMSVK